MCYNPDMKRLTFTELGILIRRYCQPLAFTTSLSPPSLPPQKSTPSNIACSLRTTYLKTFADAPRLSFLRSSRHPPLESFETASRLTRAKGCESRLLLQWYKRRNEEETVEGVWGWCTTHQRVEQMPLLYGVIPALALLRGEGNEKEEWDNLVDDRKRSHLCHHNACDNSTHVCKEIGPQNGRRKSCANELALLLKKYLEEEAVEDLGRRGAFVGMSQHASLKCLTPWPLQRRRLSQWMERDLQTALETVGICRHHRLDFPVRICRTFSFATKGNAKYSASGRLKRTKKVSEGKLKPECTQQIWRVWIEKRKMW
ncbi:hypothetical protein EK21DRAFT_87579 [Setomelanomma holmii]|uniref:Zinc-binding loop region of homing endonuclease domain-containing protein n=1 Tax=Setomelanomma holmii TaxID=210430 RepID=A0A9P4LLW1_9PLEO|nr:hypothetical protein EK21DRAFT_87579 [Setomelanomma holmii]